MSTDGPPKPPPPPPRKPPPLPPGAHKHGPPLPTKTQPVTAAQSDELAGLAMVLREEQVQARIVHYKAELETNAELDAITAQVVEQLKQLQSRVAAERAPESRATIEVEQTRAFAKLLQRIFRPDEISPLVERELKDVTRRVSRLFFESELHESLATGPDKARVVHHAEQALYYVLRRYQNRLRVELEIFEYSDEEVRERSLELLEKTQNELRVSFLTRRSPELKRLLAIYNRVLLDFFQHGFPPAIPAFAGDVIRECGAAKAPGAVGYKVLHESFGAFRQALERRFLGLLVSWAQGRLIDGLRSADEPFREETIAFVQAPQIYSDVVTVIGDSMYDFLCNEGFLDLPIDWRAEGRGDGEHG